MITQEEKKQLVFAFRNVLGIDPKETHEDLAQIYVKAIGYIKERYADRSRELKSAAISFIRFHYKKNGLKMSIPVVLVDQFFSLYDKEFENFKNSFELITDGDYLLLSFAYRKV